LFLHKSNILFEWLYPNFIWKLPVQAPTIFLTFDDGPIPIITDFVLEQLEFYDAKATFFVIGENAVKYPQILTKIVSNGHSIGNHTMTHLKGWATDYKQFTNDFLLCQKNIPKNNLFRPPYGKLRKKQAEFISKTHKIIMWDVISGDFLPDLDPEICLQKCIKYTESGTVIVFHDSQKAFPILKYVLPKYLKYFKEKGFNFEPIILKD
jgi:peptidoglycan-N-acetylglucosamine deacetylase